MPSTTTTSTQGTGSKASTSTSKRGKRTTQGAQPTPKAQAKPWRGTYSRIPSGRTYWVCEGTPGPQPTEGMPGWAERKNWHQEGARLPLVKFPTTTPEVRTGECRYCRNLRQGRAERAARLAAEQAAQEATRAAKASERAAKRAAKRAQAKASQEAPQASQEATPAA